MYDLSNVELKEGVRIFCNTEEKANALCLELHKRGFKWHSGASLETETHFEVYGEETGYWLSGKETVHYGNDMSGIHFDDLPNLRIIDNQTAKADNGTTRKSVLEQALQTVTQDRERQYGTPENSFKAIAGAWSWYLDKEITAKDVTLMMCLFKAARVKTGRFKADNWVDLIGYAACGAELEGLE